MTAIRRGHRATYHLALLPVFLLLASCQAPASTRDPRSTSNPKPLLSETRFYSDPDNPAAGWLRTANPSDPKAAVVRDRIAGHVVGHAVSAPADRLTTETSQYVQAAATANAKPVLLAESDSAGSCAPEARHRWFDALAHGIAGVPVLIIVRGGSECPDNRAALLADGVRTLHSPTTLLLLDVTGATAQDATTLLDAADVRDTLGFTLNIGRYAPDREVAAIAQAIRAGLQAATGRDDFIFVVDTSRNGGTAQGTCNPAGARVGPYSTLSADPSQAQNLWLTTPGVSDGSCGIAPQSHVGTFDPTLALALANPTSG